MKSAKPLEGIRVVELATMIAVPSCGRLLAYLGAEVIKIEPLEGVPYRTIQFLTGNEPVIFDTLNMQKKSISINAKKPEGKEYVLKLLETADVFITNVREKSLERLGLSYDALKEINPGLVYMHFSGYGKKGPMKDLPGFDTTSFFARFGILRDFVDANNDPANYMPGLGDAVCGISAVMNIMAALLKRGKTGEGEQIECALNQVASWVMFMPMIYAQYGHTYQLENGAPPKDIINATLRCGDGEYIIYACAKVTQFQNFLRAIGMEHLIDDERCQSKDAIFENTPSLFEEIAPALLKRGAEEWVGILREHDVACERHRHLPEISTDEQLLANGYIYPANYLNNDITVPAPPIDFATIDLAANERGPALGQHTEEVLKSLGCTQELIEKLKNDGTIVSA